MKLSEEIVKTTLPGKKIVWRIIRNGKFEKDIITLDDEIVNGGLPLLKTVVRNGKIVCERPSLPQIRQNAAQNFSKLPDDFKKLDGGPPYPVEFSRGLIELQARIVEKIKREEINQKGSIEK